MAILASSLLSDCIASNVVAREDRAVVVEAANLPWGIATAADLHGLYESVDIQGEASSQFWKIYYLLEDGGHYAAAALVAGANGLVFETTTGTWQVGQEGLVLDGGSPIPIAHASDHLRLETPTGVVVLRTSQFQ